MAWSEMQTASFLTGEIYGAIVWIFWAGFFFCLVNGYYQKTPAQEWAEVEWAKGDFEFNMKLSKMPLKDREAFLKGYYRTLLDIANGKKSSGEGTEETKKRVIENLKKEGRKK